MWKEILKTPDRKHFTKDGKEWKGKTHKMPNGNLMTEDPHNEKSVRLYHKEELGVKKGRNKVITIPAGKNKGNKYLFISSERAYRYIPNHPILGDRTGSKQRGAMVKTISIDSILKCGL